MNAVLTEPELVGQHYGEWSSLVWGFRYWSFPDLWVVGLCFCQGIKERGTLCSFSPLFFRFIKPFSYVLAIGFPLRWDLRFLYKSVYSFFDLLHQAFRRPSGWEGCNGNKISFFAGGTLAVQ